MVSMVKIIIAILFTGAVVSASGQQNNDLLLKGNELYKKQDYDKALTEYEKAAQKDDKDPTALYNVGNTLYKKKNLEAAEKAYAASSEKAKSKTDKARSEYNKGVSLTRQNKLQESIEAYKESLRLNSLDQQARENLQLALNQLKKQQSSSSQNKNNKKNQDKKDKKEEQNNSKLNKEQAEQMLSALRQDEKKLQHNVQKKNAPNNGSNRQDW